MSFSECSEGNAERDAHRFFSRYNLRLPLNLVPIRPDKPQGIKGLKLQDWCHFLLHRNCWHMLCGLLRPDPSREKAIWSDFWAKFEKAQPEHEVFFAG